MEDKDSLDELLEKSKLNLTKPILEEKFEETPKDIKNYSIDAEDEEGRKKKLQEKESEESPKAHNNYSISPIDAQVMYEVYKNHQKSSYQSVDVVLYSYQVPWFATAMTDGNKIWFGPRQEFYDPHPNDRLFHELSHWRISTPYGTELDVEIMAQLQMPRYSNISVSYKI